MPVLLTMAAAAALIGAAAIMLRPATPASSAGASANLGSDRTGTSAPTTRPAATSAAGNPTGTGAVARTAGGKTAVTAEGGIVRLPLADLADGRARFYTFQASGKTISFFALKSSDGVIRAAFDACDVCYPARKGYRQEGDVMVCNNCGNRFPSVSINVETGGCNPGALAREVQGDQVIIKASDVETGARYF